MNGVDSSELLDEDAVIVKEAALYPLLHRREHNGRRASRIESGERGSSA